MIGLNYGEKKEYVKVCYSCSSHGRIFLSSLISRIAILFSQRYNKINIPSNDDYTERYILGHHHFLFLTITMWCLLKFKWHLNVSLDFSFLSFFLKIYFSSAKFLNISQKKTWNIVETFFYSNAQPQKNTFLLSDIRMPRICAKMKYHFITLYPFFFFI